uniref:E-selectin n=1 Tax=Neogobius melanostomus TaxID=47308 RepID=A0A8C6T2X8_9GOBI
MLSLRQCYSLNPKPHRLGVFSEMEAGKNMGIKSLETSRSASRMISVIYLFSVIFIWTSVDCWSYYYSETTMNWTQARAWCQKNYTDMVAIQNQEEIAHLNSWLPKNYYWIGIRKIDNVWTWVGTSKALTEDAKNWAPKEPNNGNSKSKESEDCVEMYIKRDKEAGKWNDERCGKLKIALCYSAACKTDSCLHGECVETINSHRCQCDEGFYGESCEHVVFCNRDEVTVPDNGTFRCTHTYGDFAYASECQYSCEEGYQLGTPGPLKCTADKTWSDQPPTCELIQCQELSGPQWGSVRCSHPLGPFSYRSTCAFECDEGYVLSTPQSDTLFCKPTGQWNATQPFCTAVQCPALSEQRNLIITCEDTGNTRFSFGKSCSFSCATGFSLVGPNTITCTSSAEWSDSMPFCDAVQCSPLQNLEHGVIDCGDNPGTFSYENTCRFKCLPGYELVGASEVTCTSESKWSDSLPHCAVIQCQELSDPQWGSVRCSHPLGPFSYRSTCAFECDEGYVLSTPQSDTLFCKPTGQWNATQPFCTAVQCPALSEQRNLIITCEDTGNTTFSFGKSCSFSCATGFSLVGPNTITCTSSAEWSDNMPFCDAVQCSPLQNPEHGVIDCEDNPGTFSYENTCSFKCLPGYELVGASEVTCTSESKWSDSLPHCAAVHCPAIPEMENTIVSCEGDANTQFSYGNSCSFSCPAGYRLMGTKTLKCTASAEWSGSPPHCQVMFCPTLEKKPNLTMNCSSDLVLGSTCSFSCPRGFLLQGKETIECSEDAQWNEAMPICEAVVCPFLEAPHNGHKNCSLKEPLYDSQCAFSCAQDYTLDGLTLLTCDHYGNWTGDMPTCQPAPSQLMLIAAGATVGGAVLLSGLSLVMWILKRLKKRASKFDLSSSDIEVPPQVYNNLSENLL